MLSSRSLRTMQRRDLATGMASAGFNTGSTTWLVSVSAPVATWISSDALAPSAQPIPTIASLAVVQPVTGWLSLVGAAASNAATLGPNALRDQVTQQEGATIAASPRSSRSVSASPDSAATTTMPRRAVSSRSKRVPSAPSTRSPSNKTPSSATTPKPTHCAWSC